MLQTQDVAVDGWALTMLKPKNVGYASTCNSVGQVDSLLMFFFNKSPTDNRMVFRLHPLSHHGGGGSCDTWWVFRELSTETI